MVGIDFKKLEKKWQKAWEDKNIFEVKDSGKDPYYVLEMFPYPSGTGLHMGHAWNYTIGDIIARFKRMSGFNVLYPMGYDSLGLPAENAAIMEGKHPEDYTNELIPNFIRQQKAIGLSYDWTRMVSTHDASYYKWDQWIFLKMLEKGLAYQKTSAVNWCGKCNTVLANEQVVDGKCWRHDDTNVKVKQLKQWFFKTTEYADELYENLDKMDWPDRTKAMQKNWIGKSHGTEIDFSINNAKKVVLIHGKHANPKKDWYPWLASQVDKSNIEVLIPELPDADSPDAEKWLGKIGKTNPDEDTILIGHSRGGVAILRWLEKLPKGKKIKKVILVGANSGNFDKSDKRKKNKGFYIKEGYDFEKIKSHCDDFVVIHSKDDPVIPFSVGEENAAGLNAKFKECNNKGHFNIGEAPDVLEEIFNKWPVFTTRPDTIFGVTFMVVAAQHPKLDSLVTKEQRKDVDKFLKKLKSVSEKDIGDLEKEGVFTGSYAINPANGEKVPVYAGNFVVADYGSGMVMAVPAHDQRDFEFAKKYGIEIKQVVAPVFVTDEGEDAVREDKETVERDAVFGIVKHWKKDEYYCLDWKKFGWKTLVIGGIDGGESPENAVVREVKEETGYQDIKSVRPASIETHSSFFARHKDVNRYGRFKAFLVELKSGDFVEPEAEHVKNHDGEWVKKKDVAAYLNLKNYNYIWNEFINGEGSYTGSGALISSGEFNGLENVKAKHNITEWLIDKRVGRRVVNFKLRDWGISRQRYWGTPIPIIHCEKCGAMPVPEKDLPVELPKNVKFGKGNPLETNEKWSNVKCPKCGGKGRRESDTMDTFVNSSWYFMRYCDPKNDKKIFDPKKVKYWCPVDTYIGGAEHACMHLIYSRFYTKFLRDLGLIDFDEPAIRLFHQGMLRAEGGVKMSKSKPETCVLPEDISNKYGIDTARFFLSSLASPDKDIDWSEKGINGSSRFVNKIFDFFEDFKSGKDSNDLLSKLNKTIKNVSDYYDNFEYRKATIEVRELFDLMEKGCSKDTAGKFLQLLSPICPHISEEFWKRLGNKCFISVSEWPKFNESKILKKERDSGNLNEKIVEKIMGIIKPETKKVYLYVMPFEVEKVDGVKIGKAIGKDVSVFAVNDSKKIDPKNMAKRAKPGMAAIYLE